MRPGASRPEAKLRKPSEAPASGGRPSANAAAVRAYAEFLDRYHDPAARRVYARRLAQILDSSRAPAAERAAVLRRLASLDLAAGDRDAAARDVAAFTAAGGAGLSFAAAPARARRSKLHRNSRTARSRSRAWPRWLRIWSPRICCRRWPATWSPTAIRPRSANGGPGANRIPEAGGPLSFAGARARKAGRRRRRSSASKPAIPPRPAICCACSATACAAAADRTWCSKP